MKIKFTICIKNIIKKSWKRGNTPTDPQREDLKLRIMAFGSSAT